MAHGHVHCGHAVRPRYKEHGVGQEVWRNRHRYAVHVPRTLGDFLG